MSIALLKKLIIGWIAWEKTIESLFERPNVYRMSNEQNIIDIVITSVGRCYVKVVTTDGGLLMYIEAKPHDVL
jgi:hypothetical protein